MRKLILLLLLVSPVLLLAQNSLSIKVQPTLVYIEKGDVQQQLNFDFLINNISADTFTLTKISVSLFDQDNLLLHTRFLDNNGTAPSIKTIPNRTLMGVSNELVFNPFASFSNSLPIHKIKFDLIYTNNNDSDVQISTTVYPQLYKQQQQYSMPLKGRILVYDAHDAYSHHRRFNYEFAPIKSLGIEANFMRYAYDFVSLDNNNQQFKTGGETSEDYFGYGQDVFAVGAGKVIYASNLHKDDKQFDIPKLAANALELYGNCIAIEHAKGVVSIYGHLKQNSLSIKVGDRVTSNQLIGKIGVSGSSFFPHLHFEMRDGITGSSEGIPSYFKNVYILEGKAKSMVQSGLVETGSIIEAK
ncbi:MAG: M23 family metallopeptidase [Bacteroidota bacterium]